MNATAQLIRTVMPAWSSVGSALRANRKKILSAVGEDVTCEGDYFGFRSKAALCGDLAFATFLTHHRPSRRIMVCLSITTGDLRFPGHSSVDFFACADQCGWCDLDDMTFFYEFTRFRFGVYEKQCPSRRIATIEDALALAPSCEESARALIKEGWALWWQLWGGEIFAVRFRTLPTPDIDFQRIEIRTGVWNPVMGRF